MPAARGDFRIFGDFADDGSFLYASTARGAGVFDIYRGTMTGESEMIVQSELGLATRSISPDGKYALVTETVGEDANNLFLLDLTTREMKTISKPSLDDRASHTLGGFEWEGDSSAFYFSSNAGREFGSLTRYDIESGEFFVPSEAESDVGNLELCGNDSFIVWTHNEDGFDRLAGWHIAEERALTFPELPEGRYQLDCEGDAGQLMVRIGGWAMPGEIWMLDALAGSGERVFFVQPCGA